MRKFLLLFIWSLTSHLALILSFFLLYSASYVKGEAVLKNRYQMYAAVPQVLGSFTTAVKTEDARPEILRRYLSAYGSPLAHFSDLIVQVSDENDFDFRFLVAIAQCESNLGKKIPENSFNAWGYGIHSQGTLKFANWEEGIRKVANGLKKNFINKLNSAEPEEIMTLYTPPSLEKGGSWAKCVRSFMDEIQ